MWYPFFLIGGFWFWTLIVCAFIVLVLCVEFEAPFKALGTIIVTTGLLVLFGNFDPFGWIAANPLHTVGLVAGYFLSGTLWSLVKWWLFVGRRKEAYEDMKLEWFRSEGIKGVTVVPEDRRGDWASYVSQWRRQKEAQIPQAMDYKGLIMTWMAYWPWSVFWSAFDDVIRKIFATIYAELASTFQRISNRMFSSVAEDFAGTEMEEKFK